MPIQSYKDLDIWKRSRITVTTIYRVTDRFPKREMFGLTSQMRRAAISIPSNIAEGAARLYTREYIRFLSHALGSLAELETQLHVATDLEYTTEQRVTSIFTELDEIGKMTRRLVQRLEQNLATRH